MNKKNPSNSSTFPLSRLVVTVGLLSLVAAGGCVRLQETPQEFYCSSDDDCDEGERCRPSRLGHVSQSCTSDLTCQSADDCAEDEGCGDGKCVAAECGVGYEELNVCGSFSCDRENRVCFSSCSDDWSCEATRYCDVSEGRCLPAACGGDPATVCLPYVCGSEGCLTECSSDADCLSEFSCSAGRCSRGYSYGQDCEVGYDCGAGLYCDSDLSQCKTIGSAGVSCSSDEQCASGDCSYGECAASECPTSCDASTYCVDGVCVAKGHGGESCAEDFECLSGVCDGGSCYGATGDDCYDTECAGFCSYDPDYVCL